MPQVNGEQLQPEGGGEGPVLEHLGSDGVTRQYLGPSKVWASVTPIILPGHDDHKPAKTIKLIERALAQSGSSKDASSHGARHHISTIA